MKTNIFSKVAVTMMTVALGAGVVGSISGTVAWFQYSTRSTVAYQGAAAHCSENLQVRIAPAGSTQTADQNWKQDLTTSDISTALLASTTRSGTNELRPVTTGALASGAFASRLHKNPIYQYTDMTTWGVASGDVDYLDIPLQFRVEDVDGNADRALLAKKVYLSDLTIKAITVSGKIDVSEAIRVSIVDNSATKTSVLESATSGLTVADGKTVAASVQAGIYEFIYNDSAWKLGSTTVSLADYGLELSGGTPATGNKIVVIINAAGRTLAKKATSTTVCGALDLNGDKANDKAPAYDFETAGSELSYGGTGQTAVTEAATSDGTAKIYAANNTALGLANDADPYNIIGKEIGTTVVATSGAAATSWLSITVRIYLEGWQTLTTNQPNGNEGTTALWNDAQVVGAQFDVGMRFTAEAHPEATH